MLWLGELVVAAVITAIFVWLLSVAMRAGPNSADGGISSGSGWLLFLFLLLLLPTWGGGIWLMPLGPAFFGIRIVNFLLMGLVMALVIGAILAATSNVHAPQPTESERLPREELLARQQLNSWNQFFWILLVLMVVSLFWGYWWLIGSLPIQCGVNTTAINQATAMSTHPRGSLGLICAGIY